MKIKVQIIESINELHTTDGVSYNVYPDGYYE